MHPKILTTLYLLQVEQMGFVVDIVMLLMTMSGNIALSTVKKGVLVQMHGVKPPFVVAIRKSIFYKSLYNPSEKSLCTSLCTSIK